MRWRKVTLIGVGLLGGSLGLVLKQRGLAERVVGYVRRAESVPECLAAGAVDEATTDLARAVASADLVVFCTPLARMEELARAMIPALQSGALATDVGSVKASVVHTLQPILRAAGAEFVGSHPMAGSEKMGVSAAREALFEKAVTVVTPTADNSPEAVDRVEAMWRAAGSRILRLSPELHDRLVSRSSHLPHVVSAALAGYVLHPSEAPEQQQLCATGFRDTTRVASGSPEMWRDIVLANRGELREALAGYLAELREFESLLESADGGAIEEFFRQAKARRDGWSSQCASGSPE